MRNPDFFYSNSPITFTDFCQFPSFVSSLRERRPNTKFFSGPYLDTFHTVLTEVIAPACFDTQKFPTYRALSGKANGFHLASFTLSCPKFPKW